MSLRGSIPKRGNDIEIVKFFWSLFLFKRNLVLLLSNWKTMHSQTTGWNILKFHIKIPKGVLRGIFEMASVSVKNNI